MKYYHVYTKGLEDDVIFQDRQDFIVGMNQVAVSVFKTGIIMLAFVLMSNHFHFVVMTVPLTLMRNGKLKVQDIISA